jgi:hypothetical protein
MSRRSISSFRSRKAHTRKSRGERGNIASPCAASMRRSFSTALSRQVLATIAYLQKLIKDMNKRTGKKNNKLCQWLLARRAMALGGLPAGPFHTPGPAREVCEGRERDRQPRALVRTDYPCPPGCLMRSWCRTAPRPASTPRVGRPRARSCGAGRFRKKQRDG